MTQSVPLNKLVFAKNQYERVIDTSFTQLVTPAPVAPVSIPSISTAEFFNNYQEIFYQIPKFGETNSHEYLIKTSQEYVGSTFNDEEVAILLEEITSLRQINLELNQSLASLASQTGSING